MMSVSSRSPNQLSIPTSAKHRLKSNAMPKQMHPNPRKTHTRLPPNRTNGSATPVGSRDTYPMRAQTKPKLKLALKARFIKTKASWHFDKAHLSTSTNRNVPHASSNRGETTCAPHVCVRSRSTTDVTRTTSPLPSMQIAYAILCALRHC